MTQTTLPFPISPCFLQGLTLAAHRTSHTCPAWTTVRPRSCSPGASPLPGRFAAASAVADTDGRGCGNRRGYFSPIAPYSAATQVATLLVLLLASSSWKCARSAIIYVSVPVLFSCAHKLLLLADHSDRGADAGHGVRHQTASLIGFNATTCRPVENFRAAGALLVQAGPGDAAGLFFLFPRVSGPLWGLPQMPSRR